jgi:hypothetical protein
VKNTAADCLLYRLGLSVGKNTKNDREKKLLEPTRAGVADCPHLDLGLSTSLNTVRANELKLSPRAGLSRDEPRTIRGSRISSPENHHEQRFTRFVAKSIPTATKLVTHDHKAVGSYL